MAQNQSPMTGPGAQATDGKTGRMAELAGAGRGFFGDESNMAGLMVIAAVAGLALMSKSFGGLTVSVN